MQREERTEKRREKEKKIGMKERRYREKEEEWKQEGTKTCTGKMGERKTINDEVNN